MLFRFQKDAITEIKLAQFQGYSTNGKLKLLQSSTLVAPYKFKACVVVGYKFSALVIFFFNYIEDLLGKSLVEMSITT